MTNDALKPCPFCGGEAEYWHGDVAYGNYALVCKKCECMLHLNNPFSYPEDCSDDEFDELNKKALATLWNTRAALAPVDLDAGLRALDYQRDLSLIFMVAKGSKDYDETIGDRIERVQELILQLKKQNDHLAAQGYIGGGEGWRDISTIPDDVMSGVDLWDDRNEKRHINCTFNLRLQAWADENFSFVEIPTHWMPIPAAPKKEE